MKKVLIITFIFNAATGFGQQPKIVGTYSNTLVSRQVVFNNDFTFQYTSTQENPFFYRFEKLSEKGKWMIAGDTIVLNPNLSKKIFVESAFKEEKIEGDTNLYLTFNHIKRYFDAEGNIMKEDTFQIEQLDYAFNKIKKKTLSRVAPNKTFRCAFAGFIPKEIITPNHTISVAKPTETIKSIFIGCYELQSTKEFIVNDSNSNHLTLNVYSNYYQDGQIRQMKLLIKNDNVLYQQTANNEFVKDNFWRTTSTKLKKQKAAVNTLTAANNFKNITAN